MKKNLENMFGTFYNISTEQDISRTAAPAERKREESEMRKTRQAVRSTRVIVQTGRPREGDMQRWPKSEEFMTTMGFHAPQYLEVNEFARENGISQKAAVFYLIRYALLQYRKNPSPFKRMVSKGISANTDSNGHEDME